MWLYSILRSLFKNYTKKYRKNSEKSLAIIKDIGPTVNYFNGIGYALIVSAFMMIPVKIATWRKEELILIIQIVLVFPKKQRNLALSRSPELEHVGVHWLMPDFL